MSFAQVVRMSEPQGVRRNLNTDLDWHAENTDDVDPEWLRQC